MNHFQIGEVLLSPAIKDFSLSEIIDECEGKVAKGFNKCKGKRGKNNNSITAAEYNLPSRLIFLHHFF